MGNMIDDFEKFLRRLGFCAALFFVACIGAAYVLGRFMGGAQ